MTLTAAHLDALILSGCTAEQIVALVKADMAEREAEQVMRRVKDAERRRRHRERHAESRDVTVTECDVTERVSLDKEKSPTPPKEIKPFPHTSRAKGWHRLPADWEPRPLPKPIQSKVDQWPPGSLDDELANFRRWAANAANTNGKGRKLDWDQAWRNWIGRKHDERYSRNSENTNLPRVGKTTAAIAGLGGFDDHSPM